MKLVNATKLDNDLTDIADLLREKTGKTEVFSFPTDFINNINNLITFEEFVCTTLQKPVYTSSTSIPAYAFTYSDITEIHGPNVTTFEEITFPGETLKRGYQFEYCKKLSIIDLPNLINTTTSCFAQDQALINVYIPNAQLRGTAFSNCLNLKTVCAAGLMPGASSVFISDSALIGVEFLNSFSSIPAGVFSGCTNFDTLILRSSTLIPLDNLTAFNGNQNLDSFKTKFASDKTGGILYVPESLIDSYTTATNWSTLLNYTNNQILPIEGSIYETQHINGELIGG